MKPLSILFLLFHLLVLAQFQNNSIDDKNRPLNSLQLNLFGDASISSLNYERQFEISPSLIISSKIGFGYSLYPSKSLPPIEILTTIPHHITGNYGKGNHFFEFGLGGTIIKGYRTKPYIMYPIIGYRFLPMSSGLINFRIFTHVFSGNNEIFIPFGVSVGLSY